MNHADDSGFTALVDAAFNGHASASSLLLVSDEGRKIALQWAEQEGHTKMLRQCCGKDEG